MSTLVPTLSTRYFPNVSSRLRDVLLIVVSSLFLAALAQIQILLPFTPVPITGQTFGVLLVGAALGSKRGAASMILYIVEGAVGIAILCRRRVRFRYSDRSNSGLSGWLHHCRVFRWTAGRARLGTKHPHFADSVFGRHGDYLCMRSRLAHRSAWGLWQGPRRGSASLFDRRCDQTHRSSADTSNGMEIG